MQFDDVESIHKKSKYLYGTYIRHMAQNRDLKTRDCEFRGPRVRKRRALSIWSSEVQCWDSFNFGFQVAGVQTS